MPFLIIEHQGTVKAGTLSGRVLIGRWSVNNVVIEDRSVSRVHAWVGLDGGRYYVADGGSRTGTFVNGQALIERHTLSDGDVIQVGPAKIKYRTGSKLPPDAGKIDLTPRPLTGISADSGGTFADCTCGAPLWFPTGYVKKGRCLYCGNKVSPPDGSLRSPVAKPSAPPQRPPPTQPSPNPTEFEFPLADEASVDASDLFSLAEADGFSGDGRADNALLDAPPAIIEESLAPAEPVSRSTALEDPARTPPEMSRLRPPRRRRLKCRRTANRLRNHRPRRLSRSRKYAAFAIRKSMPTSRQRNARRAKRPSTPSVGKRTWGAPRTAACRWVSWKQNDTGYSAEASGKAPAACCRGWVGVLMGPEAGMISFACDGCGKPFTVPRAFAGRRATCKGCGAKVVVPLPADPSELSDPSSVLAEGREAAVEPSASGSNLRPSAPMPEPPAPRLATRRIAEPVVAMAPPVTPPVVEAPPRRTQAVREIPIDLVRSGSSARDIGVISEGQLPQEAAELLESPSADGATGAAPAQEPPSAGARPAAPGKSVPKIPMRTRRLIADADQMAKAFSNGGPISVKSAIGDPPELYQVEYRLKGLQKGWLGKPKTRADHLVEIQLTSDYPRMSPKCRMLTPVFHPNIDESSICVGDHWTAGARLADLVIRIGEMLSYQAYNIKSPLNGEAAMWADLNSDKLPTDSQNLHPGEDH